MRFQAAILMGAFFFAGCVGPGQHVRGGHSFHHSRHHGGLDGLFAILEGVALITEIAESASASSAYERATRPPPPAPPPPPPSPPARAQNHWVKGTLIFQESPNIWLPVVPIALKAANQEGGAPLAYSGCSHDGQFLFALPPAGKYKLEVVDPNYEGETVFTSDGVADLFLLLSVTALPM